MRRSISSLTVWILGNINFDWLKGLVRRSRFLGFFFKVGAQRLIDRDFPVHLFVESTNRCNLRCVMCPRETDPRKLGGMDFDLFTRIVDEAAQYGRRTFCLHLFGEPLLAPRIVDMVRYIKDANPHNAILLTTNGHFLAGEKAKGLLEARVDKISVSMLAAEDETYQGVSRNMKFAQLNEKILQFLNFKEKGGYRHTKVALRIIRNERTAADIDRFREKWRSFDVELEIRNQHNYGGKIDGSFVEGRLKVTRYPCYHLWYSPAISWNGNVLLCCNDPKEEVVLGNVKEQKLADIWSGELMEQYRRYHLQGDYDKISICKDCDVWTMYPDIFFERQKEKRHPGDTQEPGNEKSSPENSELLQIASDLPEVEKVAGR